MTNLEIDKKQRRNLTTTAASMVVVIVLLVTAIIVVATNKNDQGINGVENNESTLVDDGQKTEDPNAKETKPETKTITIETDTKKAADKEALPQTGAEDFLPLAAVLGMLTTGATAFVMHKREA